jgi:hypothetical protein
MTYWSSSLFQPAFAAFLLALLAFAENPDDRRLRAWVLVTITLCAAIDWSGYVMASGLAFAAWEYRPFRIYRGLGNVLVLGCAIAGALLIGHFALGVNLLEAAAMLRSRAQMRSVSHGSPTGLVLGYVLSFGGFLLLGAVCAMVLIRNRRQLTLPHRLVVVACGCAMVENVLLMQHATEFSFDRLKLIGLIVVFGALGWKWASRPIRVVMAATAICSSIIGWQQYRADIHGHALWSRVDDANRRLVREAAAYADLRCAEIYSVPHVRGYLPFLIRRNVAEWNDPPHSPPGRCGRVTLYGQSLWTDLPQLSGALIERPSGDSVHLTAARVAPAE